MNTKGGFLSAKHALPHMKQNKSGMIVFNASTNGAKPREYVGYKNLYRCMRTFSFESLLVLSIIR